MMLFQNVCLESFGYVLPENIVTSDQIESRFRSKREFPFGQLECLSGVRERRFWAKGASPGVIGARSARLAIEASGIDPSRVGLVINSSVWREYLEPATACVIHSALGFSQRCLAFDISNACVGFLNGMVQACQMIEMGAIECALVVSTETGSHVVESAIEELQDSALPLQRLMLLLPSLTIGSGSVAAVLVHKRISSGGTKVLSSHWGTDSSAIGLCLSPEDIAGINGTVSLLTDARKMLLHGTRLGLQVFRDCSKESGLGKRCVDKVITHQVSATARQLMLNYVGLDGSRDYATFPFLGNVVSASVPITAAIAAENGHFEDGDRVLFMGFGSGINSIMLRLDWSSIAVRGEDRSRMSGLAQLPKLLIT